MDLGGLAWSEYEVDVKLPFAIKPRSNPSKNINPPIRPGLYMLIIAIDQCIPLGKSRAMCYRYAHLAAH